MTAVEYLKQQYIERGETLPLGVFQEALEMEREQMLNFYMWMRMNDSAEAYFHYSDDDMFAEYLNQNK